jgi:hypothetical protein
MADRPTRADVALAMTTMLHYQQRAGRFGREVQREAMDDASTPMGAERFETVDYVVDAHAVAEAIITRLLDGRTIKPPRPSR